MATRLEGAHPQGFFANQRNDTWWVSPLLVLIGLTAFVGYATYRVFENQFYEATAGALNYHTPFGHPDLTFLVPGFLASIPVVGTFFTYPAFVLLPLPAGFRVTCYYYRKAYYRSFAGRPAACGVEAVKGAGYKGERGLLILQNAHRYFLYLALIVLLFNGIDMVRSMVTPDGLYFGIGSAIMIANVLLLSAYTLGCHSLRHLVGGKLDCFSCSAVAHTRHTLWGKVTMLNQRHMLWAWLSLMWVGLTDFYIRYLASSGVTTLGGLPA